jgi:hypothetical protein
LIIEASNKASKISIPLENGNGGAANVCRREHNPVSILGLKCQAGYVCGRPVGELNNK